MNIWITRAVAGAACTIGTLALGVGIAHADETSHGLLDVKANVKIGTHQSPAKKSAPLKIVVKAKVHAPVKARVNVRVNTPRPAARKPVHVSLHRSAVTVRAKAAPVKAKVRVNLGQRTTAKPVVRAKVTVGHAAKARAKVELGTAAKAKAKVDLGRPVKAKVELTVGDGATHPTPARPSLLIPSVAADARARVLDLPVLACVRLNAGACDEGSAGSASGTGSGTGTTNPGLPVIGTDVTATVTDLVDGAVCLRINGGTCSDPTGTDNPGGPVSPGGPTTPIEDGGDNPGTPVGGGTTQNGDQGTSPVVTDPTAALTLSGAGGQGRAVPVGLAATGADGALTVLLLTGLMSLLTGGLFLRRRRSW